MKWSTLGKSLLKVGKVASLVDPIHFGFIAPLAEMAERFQVPGDEKKAAVMSTLEAEIALLPAEKQDEARALLSAAVDAYVAARNAEAKARDAYAKAEQFIDALKQAA